jgi:hypothetical protein
MFDSETSQMMTAAIFGLSTLISSYQARLARGCPLPICDLVLPLDSTSVPTIVYCYTAAPTPLYSPALLCPCHNMCSVVINIIWFW